MTEPMLPLLNGEEACSAQSASAAEPLAATAPEVGCWLLIEHRGRWGRDVKSSLPAALNERLAALATQFPELRVQLIRQKQALGPRRGFVVRAAADPARAFVKRFEFEDHAGLAALDLEGMVASANSAAAGDSAPLYLVCAHGARDRCCARLGVPLWHALQALLPAEQLWQTSHLGGHRFAATLVHLPSGACYGRLREEHAAPLVAAHTAGRLLTLDHYRGATTLPRPAQAAAIWWRRQQGDALDIADAAPLRGCTADDDGWLVAFDASAGIAPMRVVKRRGAARRLASCAAAEAETVSWFEAQPTAAP